MIILSKRLFHAIEAVLTIAYNMGHMPVSGKDIALRQNMPPRYLEQMMQKLVREGILRGVRGPRGGYLLAREKRRITLGDICTALDEHEELPVSTPLGNQVVLPLMHKLKTSLDAQLQDMTLAELCDRAADMQIAKNNEDHHDFTI